MASDLKAVVRTVEIPRCGMHRRMQVVSVKYPDDIAPVQYRVSDVGPGMLMAGGVLPAPGTELKPYVPHLNYELATVMFQQGNPAAGINGLTNEILLSIVADRLVEFQKSPVVACPENAAALEHVRRALAVLEARTLERESRGVEGQRVS